MKLVSQSFTKDNEGYVKLIPEEGEDLWHVYNLIREGDVVTATTFRKVAKDTGTSTESERVKLKLALSVEKVLYDGEGEQIRVSGQNMTENEWVKVGAYHTLELGLQRAFAVQKVCWDALDLDRIRQATDPAASADLAVLMLTEGLANLCLVGGSTTVVKSKVETTLPKKRGAASSKYDKELQKFFKKAFQAVERHVDWEVVKCLVLAGPGFTKDQFKTYLDAEAVRENVRPLILNKQKILTAQASSAYKHSLKEVLAAPGIAVQIKDTKAAREVGILQDFMQMLATDPARAFYGPGHVLAAHDLGAIQTLLLTDSLFRVADVAKRRRYATLVDEVNAGGGEAVLFSAMHVSGEQLNQLTGVAAILRFPLPDIEDQEFDADGHGLDPGPPPPEV